MLICLAFLKTPISVLSFSSTLASSQWLAGFTFSSTKRLSVTGISVLHHGQARPLSLWKRWDSWPLGFVSLVTSLVSPWPFSVHSPQALARSQTENLTLKFSPKIRTYTFWHILFLQGGKKTLQQHLDIKMNHLIRTRFLKSRKSISYLL